VSLPQFAGGITENWKADALVVLAAAVAKTQPASAVRLLDEAEHHAHRMSSGIRGGSLAKIAAATASTDPARAEFIARTVIPIQEQVQSLIKVAMVAAESDPARSIRLLDDIERLAELSADEYWRATAMVGIAEVIQKLGLSQHR
jgi:hypothetical protein